MRRGCSSATSTWTWTRAHATSVDTSRRPRPPSRPRRTGGACTCPRGATSNGPGQYELLEKMMARMQWVVPLTVLLVVLLLVANFQQPHRGVHRPAVGAFRARGQRLADVAARLPALHRELRRAHRHGGPGSRDGHRHDRLPRRGFRAPPASGQGARPERHHLGAHGRHRPARAPQADDRVHDALRPGAPPLEPRHRRGRDEAHRRPHGRRALVLGVPHAGDHPRGLHVLATVAASARPAPTPPFLPADRTGRVRQRVGARFQLGPSPQSQSPRRGSAAGRALDEPVSLST